MFEVYVFFFVFILFVKIALTVSIQLPSNWFIHFDNWMYWNSLLTAKSVGEIVCVEVKIILFGSHVIVSIWHNWISKKILKFFVEIRMSLHHTLTSKISIIHNFVYFVGFDLSLSSQWMTKHVWVIATRRSSSNN